MLDFSSVDTWVKKNPNWALPSPPPDCSCGLGKKAEPFAYLDDGWYLHWYCEECGDGFDYPNIDWPFGPDDVANGEELEQLGFNIDY
jgi:hypothetical protein